MFGNWCPFGFSGEASGFRSGVCMGTHSCPCNGVADAGRWLTEVMRHTPPMAPAWLVVYLDLQLLQTSDGTQHGKCTAVGSAGCLLRQVREGGRQYERFGAGYHFSNIEPVPEGPHIV